MIWDMRHKNTDTFMNIDKYDIQIYVWNTKYGIWLLISCQLQSKVEAQVSNHLTPKGRLSLQGTNGILGRYLQADFLKKF